MHHIKCPHVTCYLCLITLTQLPFGAGIARAQLALPRPQRWRQARFKDDTAPPKATVQQGAQQPAARQQEAAVQGAKQPAARQQEAAVQGAKQPAVRQQEAAVSRQQQTVLALAHQRDAGSMQGW
jgi:hypothetical protein